MKKVIVIVISYNGMKHYKKCFNSLRRSTIPLETIVIDNKSDDTTVDYIKSNYPEISLIKSEINLGFGKANNLGFRYALDNNADYVFLLNQDAWIEPNTIELLLHKMKQYPEYSILSPIHLDGSQKQLDYGFNTYMNSDNCPSLISDCIVQGKAQDKIYDINFVNAALWLMSVDCLNKIGGFNPLFPHYGEDLNYSHRLAYHNLKIGVYPHTFATHNRNKNKSEQSLRKQINASYVYYLSLLLDNRNPIIGTSYKLFLGLALEFTKNILSFNFKASYITIRSFLRLVINLLKINNHRKIDRITTANYIFK